ncbi:MAG: hypothetical protein K2L13_01215, partial [Opitutales bacterium]|nr:hypothetical protein [Opitutales bacterium]
MTKDTLEKLFNKLNFLNIKELQTFIKCLWTEREQIYKILNLLNDGILILSENWSINYSNQPAKELFAIDENTETNLIKYVPDLA